MATTLSLDELVSQVTKMLPIYQQKNNKALKPYITNIEWNLKKLKGEISGEKLDEATWESYTASDFANIGLLLGKGEPGQEFATSFQERIGAKDSESLSASDDIPVTSPAPTGAPVAASSSAPAAPFDVRGFLKQKASHADEKLQWQTSVVDLFKLYGLDSGLASRKKVAKDLGLSEAEIGTVGSEEGNELLRSRMVGVLAQNSGSLPGVVV